MGSSQLEASPYRTISLASAPRRGRSAAPRRRPWQGPALLLFAAVCGVIAYVLRPGALTDDTYAFTFTTPGSYQYFCYIHPHMVGTIVVQAASGSNATQ